jgi:hypothetical protein
MTAGPTSRQKLSRVIHMAAHKLCTGFAMYSTAISTGAAAGAVNPLALQSVSRIISAIHPNNQDTA